MSRRKKLIARFQRNKCNLCTRKKEGLCFISRSSDVSKFFDYAKPPHVPPFWTF